MNHEATRRDGRRRARTKNNGRLAIRGNGRQRDMAGCAGRPKTDPTKGSAGRPPSRTSKTVGRLSRCTVHRGARLSRRRSEVPRKRGNQCGNYLDTCRRCRRHPGLGPSTMHVVVVTSNFGNISDTSIYVRHLDYKVISKTLSACFVSYINLHKVQNEPVQDRVSPHRSRIQ